MATKRSSHYQISGAGVLSINSTEYFRTDRGRKQIEALKKLQQDFENKKKEQSKSQAAANG